MDSPTPATDAHCGPSAPVRGSVGGAHSSWPHRPAPRAPRRSPADLRQLARLPCRLRHPHTPALRGTAPRRPSAARATEPLINRPFCPDNMILGEFSGSFARCLLSTLLKVQERGYSMPKTTPSQHPKLLDEVRQILRLQHYSIHTERSYVEWIVRFVRFHGMRSR